MDYWEQKIDFSAYRSRQEQFIVTGSLVNKLSNWRWLLTFFIFIDKYKKHAQKKQLFKPTSGVSKKELQNCSKLVSLNILKSSCLIPRAQHLSLKVSFLIFPCTKCLLPNFILQSAEQILCQTNSNFLHNENCKHRFKERGKASCWTACI